MLVTVLSLTLLPVDVIEGPRERLDVAGAITITLSLMLAVYAIVNGNEAGWMSVQTLGLLALSIALAAAFVAVESRAVAPLVPLSLFRLRNLSTANAIAVLMAGSLFACFSRCTCSWCSGTVRWRSVWPSCLRRSCGAGSRSDFGPGRDPLRLPAAADRRVALFGPGVLCWRGRRRRLLCVDVLPAMPLQGFGAGIASTRCCWRR